MLAAKQDPLAPVHIFHRDHDVVVARTGALCVAIWRGAVSRGPFEKQRAALATVVEEHPGQAGFLCVVEPDSTPPDDELRHASTDMIVAHGERLACVTCSLEGNGFKAAIARGVVTGMLLFVRGRTSHIKFHANVRSSLRWMQSRMVIPSVDALAAAVEDMRSQFPPSDASPQPRAARR